MKKVSVNQRTAAAFGAYKFSDIIEFDSTFFKDARSTLEELAEDRVQNLFGQQTKIFNCEGTEDVFELMYGAMKGGAVASGFIKDSGALNVSKIVGKYDANNLPAVFYVATDDKNANSYNFSNTTGFMFPSNAQEAADFSVLAHLSIGKSYKPFVVALNNRSNETEEIELPENEDINKLFDVVAFCGTRARALKKGISCDIEVPILLKAKLPEIIDHYMQMINKEWGRNYKWVDYVGAPKAEVVFVSAGTETDVIEAAINELVKSGKKVGLVKVKVLAPFCKDSFLKAMPKSCKKAVLIGQDAGACPKNPVFKMLKALVPAVEWIPDEFSLGRTEATVAFVKTALAAIDMDAPKAGRGEDKYFAQGMDSKRFAVLENAFTLGKKRWVIANSIGANNVMFGLGMTAAFEQRRDWILNEVLFLADNTIFPSVSDRGYEYLEVKDDTEKSLPALKALLADKVGADTHCSTCTNIRQELEFLDKRYFWIYGGDSRIAPIDWAAIEKALKSGENINIFCVQDKSIYKKAAEKTGALDLFFRAKNINGVYARTITKDMDAVKIEALLSGAEKHIGPSIVVLFA